LEIQKKSEAKRGTEVMGKIRVQKEAKAKGRIQIRGNFHMVLRSRVKRE
jgi:hypothetical protein